MERMLTLLYKFLKESSKGVLGTEAIKWNFTKFLVDKNGKVVKDMLLVQNQVR